MLFVRLINDVVELRYGLKKVIIIDGVECGQNAILECAAQRSGRPEKCKENVNNNNIFLGHDVKLNVKTYNFWASTFGFQCCRSA